MIGRRFAEQFAREWIEAWNAHDLPRILELYEDDFEMSSPVIPQLAGEPSGKLRGMAAVGDYWTKALKAMPTLHFELRDLVIGVDSLVLVYEGHRGLSAEVIHFGPSGKVARAFAHYAKPPG